jgi:hypothetical protein
MMDKELLAYCGLFCSDCAGHSGDIAASAADLAQVLEAYQFDRTARALFSEQIGDYDAFRDALAFLTELRCPEPCRERSAGETDCRIRACCIERGLWACYECDSFETCSKLEVLEDLHGDSCIRNLRAIRAMGLEAWLAAEERFWFGNEDDT